MAAPLRFLPGVRSQGFLADYVSLPNIEDFRHRQWLRVLVVKAHLDMLASLEERCSCSSPGGPAVQYTPSQGKPSSGLPECRKMPLSFGQTCAGLYCLVWPPTQPTKWECPAAVTAIPAMYPSP